MKEIIFTEENIDEVLTILREFARKNRNKVNLSHERISGHFNYQTELLNLKFDKNITKFDQPVFFYNHHQSVLQMMKYYEVEEIDYEGISIIDLMIFGDRILIDDIIIILSKNYTATQIGDIAWKLY